MDYSEMMSIVQHQLRKWQDEEGFEAESLCADCARAAAEQAGSPVQRPSKPSFPSKDRQALEELCAQAINDLLRSGVLIFAFANRGRAHRPNVLCVSEYGRRFLEQETPNPYDPDGYLAHLRSALELDPIVVEYIGEALQAFRQGCYRSTTVMTGGASERLALLLGTALAECSKSEVLDLRGKYGRKLDEASDLPAATRIALIGDIFGMLKDTGALKAYPDLKEAAGNLPTLLGVIRRARNEHGHPREVEATRETALMALQVFPEVCKHTYQLMAWLAEA